MKTLILTAAIAISTVFGVTKSATAATKNNEQVSTVITEVTSINKIEVHGNVELFVSNGTTDQVKVYNSYYAESALVQDQNGVLNISSYTAKKLVVWVTASELSSLSVYDESEVKSFGKLSAIDLDVKLFDHASAQLNVDTYATTVTLTGKAKANLAGTINEGTLKHDTATTLNTTDLAVAHLNNATKAAVVTSFDMPEIGLI